MMLRLGTCRALPSVAGLKVPLVTEDRASWLWLYVLGCCHAVEGFSLHSYL